MDEFLISPMPFSLSGAAHPPDRNSEAVLEKAFWDTGAGAAGPQPGHTGKPRYPVIQSPADTVWCARPCLAFGVILPSARPGSFAVDQI